jgi:acyl carrier protein
MNIENIDVEKRIAEIFSAVLKKKIEIEHNILREEELAWDSIANLELVMILEDEFNMRFSQEQLEDFKSKSWVVMIVLGNKSGIDSAN